MEQNCKVCGHPAHEPGGCMEFGLVDGCMCMSCIGICTCDGQSWEYNDALPTKTGGKYRTPDEY